jgi:hypothetical protein
VRRESGWDSASNSFIEPRPQDEQNESQVQEAYRNYLQSTTGGGGGGGGDHQLMEAYNEMRARCLMLTERVMQLEQVAHGVEAQRDAILDQKEKVRYMIQPLVELYGGCVVVLKVSWCGIRRSSCVTGSTPSPAASRGWT